MGKDFFEIEIKKIKLTDIKSYEITSEEVNNQRIEEVKPNVLVRIILFFASPGTTGVKREIVKSGKRPYDVLIKTIQGDEYRFSKNEYVFDVQEKVRELNEYLNSK
ncbi:hypothetical protein ACQKGD_25450 [Peribacillus frigoritolerans]|uniref:hypothetical protein n=1 Tax=Peribacillus frigoritolerans TaxID=450367 RepID=UPI00207925BC|nr:hypothetical protein [Peribacillus frigoritolerans]USK68138.1 hypothetical protein LIT26_30330 [Peribacillus frigoritolerans]